MLRKLRVKKGQPSVCIFSPPCLFVFFLTGLVKRRTVDRWRRSTASIRTSKRSCVCWRRCSINRTQPRAVELVTVGQHSGEDQVESVSPALFQAHYDDALYMSEWKSVTTWMDFGATARIYFFSVPKAHCNINPDVASVCSVALIQEKRAVTTSGCFTYESFFLRLLYVYYGTLLLCFLVFWTPLFLVNVESAFLFFKSALLAKEKKDVSSNAIDETIPQCLCTSDTLVFFVLHCALICIL